MTSYAQLMQEIRLLGAKARHGYIGESELGRLIPYLAPGQGRPLVVCVYATHAREQVTASLALLHAADYLRKPIGNVVFVPLHNPDGAELCRCGVSSVQDRLLRRKLIAVNRGEDFSLWKANAYCVDLNVNFPARWGQGKGNRRRPSPCGYIGKYPLCAKENMALVRFIYALRPDALLCFHTKGEVIYWEFGQTGEALSRDRAIAKRLSLCSGYPLVAAGASVGGLKDWCIQVLHIPAFTIEVGSDRLSHPLVSCNLPDIYAATRDMIAQTLDALGASKSC